MPPVIKPRTTTILPSLAEAGKLLDEFREKATKFPTSYSSVLATMLRAVADELDPSPTKRDVSPPEDGETAIERLEAFFRDRDNAPATIAEMEDATGVPYLSLRGFLYKRHKDKFTQVPVDSGRAGKWVWTALAEEQQWIALAEEQKRSQPPSRRVGIPPKATKLEES